MINVSGTPTPPPGPQPVTSPAANPFFTLFFPGINGAPVGEALVPPISSLSRLTWKPIGTRLAYGQFLPTKPFVFVTRPAHDVIRFWSAPTWVRIHAIPRC